MPTPVVVMLSPLRPSQRGSRTSDRRGALSAVFRAALLFVSAAGLAACASSGKRSNPWDPIARELLAMEAEDQAIRAEVADSFRRLGRADGNVTARMRAIDRRNTARLQEIVRERGWPRPARVGAAASHAAWVLAQHADHVPEFQEEVLELIAPLVSRAEVTGESFALLTDRVRVARGLPQRYGTQYLARSIDGVLHFGPSTPIEDPASLDERRSELGLMPHREYVAVLREQMNVPIHAPPIPTSDESTDSR